MSQDVSVQPWPHPEPPIEATIRRMMTEEGVPPYRWSNGPGDVYAAHTHTYHKVIYVVQGSITFGLPHTGQQIHLKVGDRLDLPAHTVHNAVVEAQGVACLEGHHR